MEKNERKATTGKKPSPTSPPKTRGRRREKSLQTKTPAHLLPNFYVPVVFKGCPRHSTATERAAACQKISLLAPHPTPPRPLLGGQGKKGERCTKTYESKIPFSSQTVSGDFIFSSGPQRWREPCGLHSNGCRVRNLFVSKEKRTLPKCMVTVPRFRITLPRFSPPCLRKRGKEGKKDTCAWCRDFDLLLFRR